MKRLILLIVSALLLMACSPSSLAGVAGNSLRPQPSPSAAVNLHCRDLAVKGLTRSIPVPGAFNCFNDVWQSILERSGIHNDAELAAGSNTPPVWRNPKLLPGSQPGPAHGYEYAVLSDGTPALFMVWLDADGRVADFMSYTP